MSNDPGPEAALQPQIMMLHPAYVAAGMFFATVLSRVFLHFLRGVASSKPPVRSAAPCSKGSFRFHLYLPEQSDLLTELTPEPFTDWTPGLPTPDSGSVTSEAKLYIVMLEKVNLTGAFNKYMKDHDCGEDQITSHETRKLRAHV